MASGPGTGSNNLEKSKTYSRSMLNGSSDKLLNCDDKVYQNRKTQSAKKPWDYNDEDDYESNFPHVNRYGNSKKKKTSDNTYAYPKFNLNVKQPNKKGLSKPRITVKKPQNIGKSIKNKNGTTGSFAGALEVQKVNQTRNYPTVHPNNLSEDESSDFSSDAAFIKDSSKSTKVVKKYQRTRKNMKQTLAKKRKVILASDESEEDKPSDTDSEKWPTNHIKTASIHPKFTTSPPRTFSIAEMAKRFSQKSCNDQVDRSENALNLNGMPNKKPTASKKSFTNKELTVTLLNGDKQKTVQYINGAIDKVSEAPDSFSSEELSHTSTTSNTNQNMTSQKELSPEKNEKSLNVSIDRVSKSPNSFSSELTHTSTTSNKNPNMTPQKKLSPPKNNEKSLKKKTPNSYTSFITYHSVKPQASTPQVLKKEISPPKKISPSIPKSRKRAIVSNGKTEVKTPRILFALSEEPDTSFNSDRIGNPVNNSPGSKESLLSLLSTNLPLKSVQDFRHECSKPKLCHVPVVVCGCATDSQQQIDSLSSQLMKIISDKTLMTKILNQDLKPQTETRLQNINKEVICESGKISVPASHLKQNGEQCKNPPIIKSTNLDNDLDSGSETKRQLHALLQSAFCKMDFVNGNCISYITHKFQQWFSNNAHFNDMTVGEFCSNHLVDLNIVAELVGDCDDSSSKTEYEFSENFQDETVVNIIKDYVSFYVNQLWTPDSTDISTHVILKFAYGNMHFRECIIVSQFFSEPESLKLKDFICRLSFVALLVTIEEYRRKKKPC